ncbi:MAG: MarC family protein [Bdellovibrionaceae bacterium]|nr:MarC family protein [Pseudobdellovibrionaceae bacterium]
MEELIAVGTKFMLAFISLFMIVDPLGTGPVVLSLTRNYSAADTERIIKRACLIGAQVLIFFQLFGNFLFGFLHIDLNAFKIAGGLLLFMTAWDMIKAKTAGEKYPSEVHEAVERDDISIFPIAMPLLAGPGAITSVIVYSNSPDSSFLENSLVSILAIVLTFFLAFQIMRYSNKVKKLLGQSGIAVLQRVMGILLASLSLQLITEGSTLLVFKILQSA